MSQTTFIAPVETIRGELTGHRADDRVLVNRRKCFGKDAKGRPYYGPSETYIYHIHQGKWSEGAEQNRTIICKFAIFSLPLQAKLLIMNY